MLKRYFFLILFITFIHSTHAQNAPELINYQGLARDASGQPLSGQSITVSFTIWQGSPGGTNVFTESHNKTTNNFGLFDLKIGSINTSAFQSINWANGPFHLEVAINGNSLGSQQMVSVPYALYAKSAGSVNLQAGTGISISGGTITNTAPGITYTSGTNVSITSGSIINATPQLSINQNSLSISGGNAVVIPTLDAGTNVSITGGSINAHPTLALNATTLSISGGNSVVLPASASPSFASIGISTISPASGNSFTITTPSPIFVNGQNINVTGTYPQYTISSTPSLALNGSSLSISGSNTVVLPTPASTTVSGLGNAVVTQPATHSFVVNVPQQTLNISGTGNTSSYSLTSTSGGTVVLPETTLSINPPHSISTSPGGFSKTITVIPASLSIINGIGTSTLSISHGTTGVNSVTFTNGNLSGSFWSLNGNTLTTANFLGSTNNIPVAFHASNSPVMRLYPSTSTAGILGLGGAALPTFTPQSLAHFLIPNSSFTSAIRLGHGNQPNAEWHFDVDGTSNMFLKNEGLPGSVLTFSNNGNLGVNNSLPAHRLHITHSGTNSALFVENSGNGSVLHINHNNTGYGIEINSGGSNHAININKSSINGKGINLNMPTGSPMEGIHITHDGFGKGINIDKNNIGDAISIDHYGLSGGHGLRIQKNGNWGNGIFVSSSSNDAVLYASRFGGSGYVATFIGNSSTNTVPVVYADNIQGNADVIVANAQSMNSKNSLVLHNGHIKSSSTSAPTLSISASNTFSINLSSSLLLAASTDVKGQVMAAFTTTFSVLSGDYIRFKITFAKPYATTSTPIVVISPSDTVFPEGIFYHVKNVTPNDFEIEVINASILSVGFGTTSIKFNYFVIE